MQYIIIYGKLYHNIYNKIYQKFNLQIDAT